MYQQLILERDRAPHHEHAVDGATHRATLDSPLCGDTVTVELRLVDGAISAAGFRARGCALSRAAADLAIEAIAGQPAEAVRALAARMERFVAGADEDVGALAALAGVRAHRTRRTCACLALRALSEALGA